MTQPDEGNGKGRVWEYPALQPLPPDRADDFTLTGTADVSVEVGTPAEYDTGLKSGDAADVTNVIGTMTLRAPGIADWDLTWETHGETFEETEIGGYFVRPLAAVDTDTLRATYGPMVVMKNQDFTDTCRLTIRRVPELPPLGEVLGRSELHRGQQLLAARDYRFTVKEKP